MIYKLKGWTYNIAERSYKWTNLYLDVTQIFGWYIPEDDGGFDADASINIYVPGDVFTIKQEEHITKYLLETFVEKAIE